METTKVLNPADSLSVHQSPRDKYRNPGWLEKEIVGGVPMILSATAKVIPGYPIRVKTVRSRLRRRKRTISRTDHRIFINCKLKFADY